MIAFAKPEIRQPARRARVGTAVSTWHAGFLKLLPAIRRHVRRCFRYLKAEAREEAVQEAVAIATVVYARLGELGKESIAYPGALARFAVCQILDGRRVTGSGVYDVMSAQCQRLNDIVVHRLDRIGDEAGEWQEVTIADRRATPADVAAMRIDFRAWLCTLPKSDRKIVLNLAVGETTNGVAEQLQISAERVSQLRRELFGRWQEFQGEPAVAAA